jgi:uncharacterized protein YfdQ (DUF2303 family)
VSDGLEPSDTSKHHGELKAAAFSGKVSDGLEPFFEKLTSAKNKHHTFFVYLCTKLKLMATYLLDINEHNKKAKRFLEFLKDYARDNRFIEMEEAPNKTTQKAIDEVRKGKIHKAESVKALFESV